MSDNKLPLVEKINFSGDKIDENAPHQSVVLIQITNSCLTPDNLVTANPTNQFSQVLSARSSGKDLSSKINVFMKEVDILWKKIMN